jgi:hypothetical protein
MPISSRGSRRATTWAIAQKPRPMPRIVRLGRPANDNSRRTNAAVRAIAIVLATALVMITLFDWRLI